jgi:hypothetical protein
MSQDSRTEYTPETEHPLGGRAEETRPWDSRAPSPPSGINPHHMAARGFAQLFSLYPLLAIFIIVLDAMESAVDVATLGISAPVLWLIGGIFTGIVVFMGQKKWGGDDQEAALIKSLIVAFLVALPTPFPSFLTVPSAIVGTVQMLRRKVN